MSDTLLQGSKKDTEKKSFPVQVYLRGNDEAMLGALKERFNIEHTSQLFRHLLKKEYNRK